MKKLLAVMIVVKDGLLGIAAGGDVIDAPGNSSRRGRAIGVNNNSIY